MSSRDKKPSKASSSRTNSGRIRTLSDLNRPSAADDSDSESDAPQEYYAGGEKSGMLVQDPSKHDDVEAIFDRARQMGAMQAPLDNLQPSSSSRSFTGTGRLLSGDTVPSVAQLPQQPEAVTHNIVFWRNGFTVNDGPLRRLGDPENAPFLESIKKSECPKELEPADRRSSVRVNLTRKEENFPVGVTHYFSYLKAREELGYVPMVSPREGMAATISYWEEKKRSSSDGPTIFAWMFCLIGMSFLFAAAYLPDVGPVPAVRYFSLFFLQSMSALRVLFIISALAHIGEAIYAWRLAKRVDPTNAKGWLWQTLALGIFSLRLLLKRAK